MAQALGISPQYGFSTGPVHSCPICRLPHELLGHIFRLAQRHQLGELEDDDDDSDYSTVKTQPVEVVVSQVNLYFRDIALGTRVLWRHINLGQNDSVEKLRMYLARSGPRVPLHLRLDLTRGIAALTEKLDLVFEQLDRWQRFTIHSKIETSDVPVISRLYDASAPLLEQLGLCVDDVDSENLKSVRRADSEQILTQGCPRLTVLRLRGLSMHFFRPPIPNITTLYLEQTRGLFIGYEGFKDLLTAAPALAHLSIFDAIIDEGADTWPTDSVSCIPVPNLISLRLSIPGTLQHVFSDILISISAPRLEYLVLRDVGETHLDKFWQLPGVAHKFPALHSLTFLEFDIRETDRLVMICGALPGITEFTCASSTSYAPTLLLIMAGKSPTSVENLWPNLCTLNMTLDIEDLGIAKAAVERRLGSGHLLKTLRLSRDVFDYADEEEEETLEWLGGNLVIEPFLAIARWPPGSDYDPDDTWFTN
ncbi:hypothetical protein B0H16DRAFT_629268 [Mycena metata]|uniref:F-box domain-containing protein n=1 Tax=Mycena metata TaxID=1033252 RepID=A0AAD7NER7_9AGAR|nr:hypothetical protein B0H16DRAFT_629268 [Mycena metata]